MSSELKDKADLVLVTHFHKDHLQTEALSKIRRSETIILAPKNCSPRIEGDFQMVKPGDKLKIGDIHIKVVPAYNTPEGNSTRKFHHKGDGVGYIITINSHKIYHAGDKDLIPEMQEFGEVDLALIPIGGTFTMDVAEAVQAAFTLNPRIIIPMHDKDADPKYFKEKVEKMDEYDIRVIPLGLGEKYILNGS